MTTLSYSVILQASGPTPVFLGFAGGSAGKESACNSGDLGSIPGSGRSPGEGEKKNNNRIVLDKQASNKLGMELGFRGPQFQSPLLF